MNIDFSLGWHVTESKKSHVVDPVLFELLAAIQKQGALKRVTENINVSYRFAWGLLKKWEQLLGQPLVILEQGRGARLSPTGKALLRTNAKLLARFSPELDNFATHFKQEFETILNEGKRPSLNIFASHGLAIAAVRDLMSQQSSFKIDLHFHGSLESLRALHEQECDIAGFHIPIGPLAKTVAPQYLEMLDPEKYLLVYVVKRNQGLMFQADNPKNISTISSLANKNIRFINRQINSGTRLLFDHLLHAENITPNEINGYDTEEFTHMAVAAMIASGAADVGFGIAPMADKFDLGFIPLIWEHYCLAIPKQFTNDERAKKIRTLLQSNDLKQKLYGFSGYDTSKSGSIVTFKEIFG